MNPDEYETPVNCGDCCCGPDCELLNEMAPSGSDNEAVHGG